MYGQNVRIKRRGFKSRVTKVTPLRRARAKRNISLLASMQRQVRALTRTIETKSGTWNTGSVMRDLTHNNIYIVTAPGNGQPGDRLNMLQVSQGVRDEQGSGAVANRIGDKITVQGVMIKAIFENALNRPKVFYRVMIVKCAKADVPTRDTLFYNNTPVKMIDQVNTERYTIIAQKQFTITPSNPQAAFAGATGEPNDIVVGGDYNAGTATKAISMWIPGRKFGRGGNIQYVGDSAVAVKYFDYYIVCLAYDWYGTPGFENNTVGKINTLYTKLYFKDA